jgi:hypothetical protein
MPRKGNRRMNGGNFIPSSENVLSAKTVIPSSEFLSTGTGGNTAKYETAVMPSSAKMTGGKRRSKKSKKSIKRRKSMKKWFGLF